MSGSLEYSIFHEVFFPSGNGSQGDAKGESLTLQKLLAFNPKPMQRLEDTDYVVFDFETTGLSQQRDEIIEIGGLRYRGGHTAKPEEFSYLIKPTIPIPDKIAKITGITSDMVAGQPTMAEVLPDFLGFIEGAVLVAHNAEFDMGFFRQTLEKNGFQIDWPCFCTLKMSRQLISDLPSYNLDTLASHYNLTNEARHRSVGDCKVTGTVFFNLLRDNATQLGTLANLGPYSVS